MEEKTLLKSTQYQVKRGLWIFMLIVVAGCMVWFVTDLIQSIDWYNDSSYLQRRYDSVFEYVLSWTGQICLYIIAGVALISALIYAWLRSYEITVTDKRVYGKGAFGKRVDLPLDSISAVGTCAFKGVSVATSSGKISFLLVKNRDEIHKCVSTLLLERQSKAAPAPATQQETPQSNADELKKYKELLDSGVITQEEFDAKKKQLLGL